MPPEPPVERVGTLVDGRYQITEVMASGAMGAVYKAERVPHGKLVAIKFLHASFANDSEFQARFERETRVMSKLNHPNCVSVVDFGAHDGNAYLVMDYVDGTTLRARLDEGPLPPLRALAIARQVLAGLAHAHAQEILHRDVKPANIMLSEEIGHGERVRILDFGLARLQGNVGRDATQTNMVVGTPNYMAPEQTVPGAAIDARSDLYAVGVVLFEMIAGERPFVAEDTMQVLGMHRAAPVPRLVDKMKPGTELPYGVQDVINKAMAKSPKDRYQTAIEFANAIDEVLAGKLDPMEIDATLPKMKSGPVQVASDAETGSTVLAVDNTDARGAYKKPRRLWLGALVLLGSVGAMAAYLVQRNHRETTETARVAASPRLDAAAAGQVAVAPVPDAVEPADAASSSDAGVDIDAAVDIDAGADIDAGTELDGGNGVDEDEITIDPTAVENPDQTAATAAPEDEEADAPKSEEEVEKRETPPPAPQLARSVHEAVILIKQGKKDLALASLRRLWKDQPASGYIPFLLGNLYFDKKWWSVSLEHYGKAIKKNAGYRKNGDLNKNVIRMLASTKTRQSATNFLRGTIGAPCKPYLKWAAANEKSPVVRKQAKQLAGYIR